MRNCKRKLRNMKQEIWQMTCYGRKKLVESEQTGESGKEQQKLLYTSASENEATM